LDVQSGQELVSHLRQCAACRELEDDFRRLEVKMQSLRQVDLGPDFSRRMRKMVENSAVENRCMFERQPGRRSGVLGVLQELFTPSKHPSPTLLEEFNDFPPLSIGCAYFNLIGQPEEPV